MNKYIIILISLIFAYSGRSESLKSTEIVYLKQLYMSVKIFVSDRGTQPNSWEEITRLGYLNPATAEDANNKILYKSRYGFINHREYFDAVYPPCKIIVMAITSGKEGNVMQSDGSLKEGRWLIIETESQGIHTRWFSELELVQIFKEAKLDLADYTGLQGRWLNEFELSENNARSNNGKPKNISPKDSPPSVSEKTKKIIAENPKKSKVLPVIIISILAFIVFIVFIVLFSQRKLRTQ